VVFAVFTDVILCKNVMLVGVGWSRNCYQMISATCHTVVAALAGSGLAGGRPGAQLT